MSVWRQVQEKQKRELKRICSVIEADIQTNGSKKRTRMSLWTFGLESINQKVLIENADKNKTAPHNCEERVWERRLAAGAPEGIRTPDLLIRSQTLYPAELLAQL